MKKVFIILTLLTSLVASAESPFYSFVGEYEVVDYECIGENPLYDNVLSKIVILEKSPRVIPSEGDPIDLFIEFYYEGYGSVSSRALNLSAFERITRSFESDGAIWQPSDNQYFSIQIDNSIFKFIDYSKSGEFHDECSYTLKLK